MNRRTRVSRKRFCFTGVMPIDRLERRCLLSTTSFTLVPAQSTVTAAITATVDGIAVDVKSQGTSSLNSSQTSLTTEFTGTVLASVGTSTLQFVSGSSIAAENNGNWKPGDNPGASGNPTTALPANFGGEAITFLGTDYLAVRNLVVDGTSPVLTQSSGGYTTDNALKIAVAAGDAYSDGITAAAGDTVLTGDSSNDQSGKQATLTTSGSIETLTVPISVTLTNAGSTTTVTTVLTGTLVATATVTTIAPSPNYYLRLDADAQHIDLYNNPTGTGTVTQQFLYSQQSSLSLTTSNGAGSITIDNSAGNVVPTGGLTLTGDGSTTLKLIGSGNGDTVALNAKSLVYNGVSLNFSGMTSTTLDPNAGTDALAINAGELILAAPVTTGIKVRNFSAITIAAGAELQISKPSSQANRALIVASSLSIAGSTGNWTGTLDLTSNDLDLPTAALSTTTTQIAQGFNATDGGMWNGTGITSTAAATDTTHRTALGILQNNQSGSAIYTTDNPFDGTTPGAGDILVKYTYYGDTNLDGKVDGSDYSRIDNGALKHLTGWFNGDFNYDGIINGSDYTLIDNAYNTQGASLAAEVATKAGARSSTGTVAGFSPSLITDPSADSTGGWMSEPSSVAAGIFGADDDLLWKKEPDFFHGSA